MLDSRDEGLHSPTSRNPQVFFKPRGVCGTWFEHPVWGPVFPEWPDVSWIPANFLGKFIRKSGKRDGVCVGLRGLKSRELGDEVLREKMAEEPFSMLLGLLIGTIWNYSKLLFWKSVLFHWSISPVNKSIRKFLPNIFQETYVYLRAQKKKPVKKLGKKKKKCNSPVRIKAEWSNRATTDQKESTAIKLKARTRNTNTWILGLRLTFLGAWGERRGQNYHNPIIQTCL